MMAGPATYSTLGLGSGRCRNGPHRDGLLKFRTIWSASNPHRGNFLFELRLRTRPPSFSGNSYKHLQPSPYTAYRQSGSTAPSTQIRPTAEQPVASVAGAAACGAHAENYRANRDSRGRLSQRLRHQRCQSAHARQRHAVAHELPNCCFSVTARASVPPPHPADLARLCTTPTR